ncbi:MAG: membrane protein insertion efficiency factor YidD [Acidobacteria bacterium]|nr:membrane protein insertion efficiency factor YidD [Acidobacteriota bacterium]
MPIGFINKIAIAMIELVWQKRLSRRYAEKRNCICRFFPSCSEYSKLALGKYGFVDAVAKTHCRIRRCTPDNTDTCIDFP